MSARFYKSNHRLAQAYCYKQPREGYSLVPQNIADRLCLKNSLIQDIESRLLYESRIFPADALLEANLKKS